ncbi:MAG TPA: hypothetical protein DIS90_01470 [Cytophagales bacterium]|nr:hypothetical protein [Cytophagales bacterium]HCR53937.1 hypothetical protein [Cytophagales bacterium]
MLKFLLIIAISIYILSKIGRFFFGMGMTASQNRSFHKPTGGNVNVNNSSAKNKNKPTVKGGEYIDYEEVK